METLLVTLHAMTFSDKRWKCNVKIRLKVTQRVISRRISSLRDIALCQLPTKEMKSKKNVVSTLNRNSKFGLVLFNWDG